MLPGHAKLKYFSKLFVVSSTPFLGRALGLEQSWFGKEAVQIEIPSLSNSHVAEISLLCQVGRSVTSARAQSHTDRQFAP